MLFTILIHAAFISLLSSAAASSMTATKQLTNISALKLVNNSQAYTPSSISNLSDTSIPLKILPYKFSVPNTQTYLRLGFGLRPHRLDLMSMGGLIAVIQHDIAEAIEIEGEDEFPGLVDDHRQRVGETLGDGFYLIMSNATPRLFTWRQLSNVMEGLRLFLIVGERNYCVNFKFWDGPGGRLGGGAILLGGDGADQVADE